MYIVILGVAENHWQTPTPDSASVYIPCVLQTGLPHECVCVEECTDAILENMQGHSFRTSVRQPASTTLKTRSAGVFRQESLHDIYE